MKKLLSILLALAAILCFAGCESSQSQGGINDGGNTDDSTSSNQSLPQTNDMKLEYEELFRKLYPEVDNIPLNEETATKVVYAMNNGNVVFTVADTEVVYTNLDDNGFKIGVFWGNNPALTTQEKRILVRSGYFSVASMTLQEQYAAILAVLTEEEKELAPDFDVLESNKVLVETKVSGAQIYEYSTPKIKIKIEISGSYGKQTSRTVVCDIYN